MAGLEKEFFDFIVQRQLIWHKRFILKEGPPWTSDRVLRDYKILNVYRELDKGTKYIIEGLQEVKDRKALLLNIVFYRFFNRHGLYEKLGLKPFDKFDAKAKDLVLERLEKLRQTEPLFSDAYLIAGRKNEPKHESVLNSLLYLNGQVNQIIDSIDRSRIPEESFEAIKQIPLVGSFLAYEIWTDLTYFKFFKQGWTDDDFVNIGPGAVWGLEIIYGKLRAKEMLEKIKHLRDVQEKYLTGNWKKISYKPNLSLRNIEHSLCEFRKFWNLSHGKGKRRKFIPLSRP